MSHIVDGWFSFSRARTNVLVSAVSLSSSPMTDGGIDKEMRGEQYRAFSLAVSQGPSQIATFNVFSACQLLHVSRLVWNQLFR